ncbi:hypothetical protein OOK58_02895 [Streptomyces sp. NBC_01728]|uniref:hypothetical protein n=1 Tax=unclassified Streptomyces TaxID=2593676 RepID=UPI0022504071|nr:MULTISPECIES: hypothetical protein [unclassified Streptomyces]MCX4461614.1 hypothetical protein [Streptomyces sp. NBC_01719]MCX4490522.1 hypothetical protein [Streptomyces sp. NBC_01728]MCX4597315.1 hypothetical protein [Streptomyces sp. NBC_01549]
MLPMQAMLGSAGWLPHARVHLRRLFAYLPQQPRYYKWLPKLAELLRRSTRILAKNAFRLRRTSAA